MGSNMLGPKSINKLSRQTDSYKIWSPNDLLDVSKLSVLKERIERRCKTATQWSANIPFRAKGNTLAEIFLGGDTSAGTTKKRHRITERESLHSVRIHDLFGTRANKNNREVHGK